MINKYYNTFSLLIILALTCISEFSLAATVNDIRVWKAPDHTRLVFDLSASVKYKITTLKNPDRLVVDIEDANLKKKAIEIDFSSVPITALRSTKKEKNNLRVIFDLLQPLQSRDFILGVNEQYNNRLVIDLYDKKSAGIKKLSSVVTKNNQRKILIAIDAGHGGEDPGAIGPKRLMEKNVVLAISRELKKLLDKKLVHLLPRNR